MKKLKIEENLPEILDAMKNYSYSFRMSPSINPKWLVFNKDTMYARFEYGNDGPNFEEVGIDFLCMKKNDAQINISIDVECPHCGNDINLLDIQEMIEEGFIYIKCLKDEVSWGCKDFKEEIECPDCNNTFMVEDVIY